MSRIPRVSAATQLRILTIFNFSFIYPSVFSSEAGLFICNKKEKQKKPRKIKGISLKDSLRNSSELRNEHLKTLDKPQ